MKKEFNILKIKITKEQFVNLIKVLAKIGLILLIFISMLLLSHSVLLSPDDYNYTFVQGTNNTQRVDSISNAIQTAKFFYNNWTGRIIPHVFIGIFRNLPPIVYELLNSTVFIIFIIFITKVLNKKSSFLSLLGVFGYLTFSMMFGEKFAWISGSFNYLWPCTFLVIFIYYFYNYFQDIKKLNILSKIALTLFAFVVGFSHENVAFVGGAFLVCLILFNIKKFFKFDRNKKIIVSLVFVMFCLGALATIFAPGNLSRMGQVTGDKSFSWEFMQNYRDNRFVLISIIVSMVLAFFVQNFQAIKQNKNFKKLNYLEIKRQFLYFILPSLIATVPMAVISYFPPREFLAYEVMFMIVFARNITIISEKFKKYNCLIAVASIVFTLIVFGKFSPSTLGQINYIIPYKNKITAEYQEALARGEKDVLVSKFEYANWIHADDWINIANFFPEFDYHMPVNALISQYYGFDRLTAIGDNDYLIEIEVDTEGINPYEVVDKKTKKSIQYMEYDKYIRYTIPKDKLGEYVLDCRKNNLKDKILNYSVRFIGGELNNQEVKLDSLIITE